MTKEHPHDARWANEAGEVPRHNAQGDHGQDNLTVGEVEEGELPGSRWRWILLMDTGYI